mmetsp:Transcript_22800/g.33293  ORF Transcript_22800/g.33293 Transcript_22800/m.33293 type:complete len:1184 (-) Transcript_22800:38-3589(-)
MNSDQIQIFSAIRDQFELFFQELNAVQLFVTDKLSVKRSPNEFNELLQNFCASKADIRRPLIACICRTSAVSAGAEGIYINSTGLVQRLWESFPTDELSTSEMSLFKRATAVSMESNMVFDGRLEENGTPHADSPNDGYDDDFENLGVDDIGNTAREAESSFVNPEDSHIEGYDDDFETSGVMSPAVRATLKDEESAHASYDDDFESSEAHHSTVDVAQKQELLSGDSFPKICEDVDVSGIEVFGMETKNPLRGSYGEDTGSPRLMATTSLVLPGTESIVSGTDYSHGGYDTDFEISRGGNQDDNYKSMFHHSVHGPESPSVEYNDDFDISGGGIVGKSPNLHSVHGAESPSAEYDDDINISGGRGGSKQCDDQHSSTKSVVGAATNMISEDADKGEASDLFPDLFIIEQSSEDSFPNHSYSPKQKSPGKLQPKSSMDKLMSMIVSEDEGDTLHGATSPDSSSSSTPPETPHSHNLSSCTPNVPSDTDSRPPCVSPNNLTANEVQISPKARIAEKCEFSSSTPSPAQKADKDPPSSPQTPNVGVQPADPIPYSNQSESSFKNDYSHSEGENDTSKANSRTRPQSAYATVSSGVHASTAPLPHRRPRSATPSRAASKLMSATQLDYKLTRKPPIPAVFSRMKRSASAGPASPVFPSPPRPNKPPIPHEALRKRVPKKSPPKFNENVTINNTKGLFQLVKSKALYTEDFLDKVMTRWEKLLHTSLASRLEQEEEAHSREVRMAQRSIRNRSANHKLMKVIDDANYAKEHYVRNCPSPSDVKHAEHFIGVQNEQNYIGGRTAICIIERRHQEKLLKLSNCLMGGPMNVVNKLHSHYSNVVKFALRRSSSAAEHYQKMVEALHSRSEGQRVHMEGRVQYCALESVTIITTSLEQISAVLEALQALSEDLNLPHEYNFSSPGTLSFFPDKILKHINAISSHSSVPTPMSRTRKRILSAKKKSTRARFRRENGGSSNDDDGIFELTGMSDTDEVQGDLFGRQESYGSDFEKELQESTDNYDTDDIYNIDSDEDDNPENKLSGQVNSNGECIKINPEPVPDRKAKSKKTKKVKKRLPWNPNPCSCCGRSFRGKGKLIPTLLRTGSKNDFRPHKRGGFLSQPMHTDRTALAFSAKYLDSQKALREQYGHRRGNDKVFCTWKCAEAWNNVNTPVMYRYYTQKLIKIASGKLK